MQCMCTLVPGGQSSWSRCCPGYSDRRDLVERQILCNCKRSCRSYNFPICNRYGGL